jgi:hypothetical protein
MMSKPKEKPQISQETLRRAYLLQAEIRRLRRELAAMQNEILDALEAGCMVEPGLHAVRIVKRSNGGRTITEIVIT